MTGIQGQGRMAKTMALMIVSAIYWSVECHTLGTALLGPMSASASSVPVR
jgi:hypothetical protein